MRRRFKPVNLVFANGETLTLPVIYQSGPGWVLRPDEARTDEEIRKGTNKSFGRSSQGQKSAQRWLTNRIESFMTTYDWPEPKSHDIHWSEPRTYTGINLALYDPIYGYDVLGVRLSESIFNKGQFTLKMFWQTTELRRWMIRKMIDQPDPEKTVNHVEESWQYQSREKATEIVQAFSRDPITQARNMLGPDMVDFPYDNDDLPPVVWPDNDKITYLDDAETISVHNDTNHMFYREKSFAKKVYTESYKEFDKLQTAFEHLGIDFRVGTDIDYSSEHRRRYVSGLTIEIPGNRKDEHNQEGHTVNITEHGVTIECGYRTNEEKWQEYMKRQAADWLQELETTTTPTNTYEDYEYKPNS